MMAASTKRAPDDSTTSATLRTVSTLIALQSTKIGLWPLRVISVARCWASASASPGGTIDRMISALAISASLAATMPAADARFLVASLRPSSEVSTLAPCSARRAATALPMAPGARTAIVGIMGKLRLLAISELKPKRHARKSAECVYQPVEDSPRGNDTHVGAGDKQMLALLLDQSTLAGSGCSEEGPGGAEWASCAAVAILASAATFFCCSEP